MQDIIFRYNKKNYTVKVPLIGVFQIKNLFMSILAAKLSGLDIKKILYLVKNIKEVNGRLQLIKIIPNQTKIFIDYAHTPAALDTALKTLKEQYRIKPDVVFGCGGERDKKKRAKMAKTCEKNDSKRNNSCSSLKHNFYRGKSLLNFWDYYQCYSTLCYFERKKSQIS